MYRSPQAQLGSGEGPGQGSQGCGFHHQFDSLLHGGAAVHPRTQNVYAEQQGAWPLVTYLCVSGDTNLDPRTKDQDLTSWDLGPASLAPSVCMPTFCPPGPNTAEVPLPGGCFFLSQICSQTLKFPGQ